MIARATTRMTMTHAMRLVAKRSFLVHATIIFDHAMTFSKLNATSINGMETPAETDTVWINIPRRERTRTEQLTDDRRDGGKRHLPIIIVRKNINLNSEERCHKR